MLVRAKERQAVFVKARLRDLPTPTVPQGYVLRHAEPGEEPQWQNCLEVAFEEYGAHPSGIVAQVAKSPEWTPDRTWFVLYGEEVVAVTTARESEWRGKKCGTIGWLGTRPAHRRKGLARAVCLAVLGWLHEHGFQRALVVTSETHRSAIRLYLSLGFEPYTPGAERLVSLVEKEDKPSAQT